MRPQAARTTRADGPDAEAIGGAARDDRVDDLAAGTRRPCAEPEDAVPHRRGVRPPARDRVPRARACACRRHAPFASAQPQGSRPPARAWRAGGRLIWPDRAGPARRISMHAESLDSWRHEHVFLGADHARNERRSWAVVALCGAMMAAENVG